MTLIKDAILAGVENDLGSGTAVDLCIITPTSKKNIKHFFDPPSVAAVKKYDFIPKNIIKINQKTAIYLFSESELINSSEAQLHFSPQRLSNLK